MKTDALYSVSKAHQKYYVDGNNVPGVTTVLSVLAKPALIHWSWGLANESFGALKSKIVEALKINATNQTELVNAIALIKEITQDEECTDYRKYRDQAADIGTLVHLMCQVTCENSGFIEESSEFIRNESIIDTVLEMIDTKKFSEFQIEQAKVGYSKFLDWWFANNVEPIANELQLVSEMHKFGGTIDLLADVNGKRTLVDFKTSKDIYDEQLCQVSAYAELLRENGHEIEQIMILRIGRNQEEGFDTRTVDMISRILYFDIFKSALNIFNKKKSVGWR